MIASILYLNFRALFFSKRLESKQTSCQFGLLNFAAEKITPCLPLNLLVFHIILRREIQTQHESYQLFSFDYIGDECPTQFSNETYLRDIWSHDLCHPDTEICSYCLNFKTHSLNLVQRCKTKPGPRCGNYWIPNYVIDLECHSCEELVDHFEVLDEL